MYQFNELWALFRQHGSSNKREAECAQLWEGYSQDLRDLLYETIRKKLELRKFVHYDPLRAMQENVEAIRSQTLSYNAYYDRYHTTEERDGWVRTFIEKEQRTVYVKSGG